MWLVDREHSGDPAARLPLLMGSREVMEVSNQTQLRSAVLPFQSRKPFLQRWAATIGIFAGNLGTDSYQDSEQGYACTEQDAPARCSVPCLKHVSKYRSG